MPSSPDYKRDYDTEYKTAKGRGEVGTGGDSGNAKRHKARRIMLKKGMVKKGQDVDHKKPISKGGGNSGAGQLRAQSPAANRGFPRNPDGSMK
jgi:hypothetical protein